ncbi:battenin isoform 2-T2 [Menidia menidia]
MEEPSGPTGSAPSPGSPGHWRNWSGFWILGLCNNYAYVVMLSAAHDILEKQESRNSTAAASAPGTERQEGNNNPNGSSPYDCSPVSTGAVLLADILPTLLIKLVAPFVVHKVPYGLRVLFCAFMAASSFLLVSFSSAMWMSILGVVFASVSSGLGELSFLSLTVFFSRTVLEGWGSGTGGAGVAGSFLYSSLIQGGLTPRVTLLIMLVVPLAMVVSYFGMLVPEHPLPQWRRADADRWAVGWEERQSLTQGAEQEEPEETSGPEDGPGGALSFSERLHVIRGLLRFVLPLGLVYFAEYFINQGLMEILFFHNFFLSHAEQYRWYQCLYQIGVFLSRSSLRWIKIRRTWALALLQVVNAVFLLLAARYQFLPSAWLVFAIILYEGLLGGAAYVNTFHFISKETDSRHREFAMAAASVGDSLGIALAGLAAFPTHGYFCSL